MAREATRRRVLAAATALPLAALPLAMTGCRGIAALGSPPKPAPDVAVASAAVAVERQLIARYGAVLGALPGLTETLRPLLAQHHDHLASLRARLIVPPGGQPLPTPRATVPPASPPRFTTPAAGLGYLRDAEDAAAAALLAHLATAPPSLAQLLASVSASEATHALILATAARHP